MHVVETKGKSTGPNLRGVCVLIEFPIVEAIDRLIPLRPDTYTQTTYLFGR